MLDCARPTRIIIHDTLDKIMKQRRCLFCLGTDPASFDREGTFHEYRLFPQRNETVKILGRRMSVESKLCCVVGGSINSRKVEYADVKLWHAFSKRSRAFYKRTYLQTKAMETDNQYQRLCLREFDGNRFGHLAAHSRPSCMQHRLLSKLGSTVRADLLV
jgi:hypothetical protein